MHRSIIHFALPLVALGTMGTLGPAMAQDPDAATTALAAESDPQAAVARVRTAVGDRPANEILSISGTQKIDDQVIYVDTLRFDNEATMQLKAGDRDAIYIVAREIRLSGPTFKGTIDFYDREVANGADGAAPPGPRPRMSRSGGNGSNGAAGQPGDPGKPGKTRQLPTVYIVTGGIVRSSGGPQDFSDLRIQVDGIDGGTGGTGGKGQRGQDGQDGRHGRANDLRICTRGPRSGGNGGRGGSFGPGGIGGDGGNGATVVFLVPQRAVDDVRDIRIRNRGGLPGIGGRNGEPGSGGNGGSRGSRPGTCDGASAGSKGSTGASAPSMRAADGQNEGERGRVYYHVANFFAGQ